MPNVLQRCIACVLLATLLVAFAAGCSNGTSTQRVSTPPADVTPPARTPASTPSPTSDGTITIAAVGDVMLARDLTTLMDEHGAIYPFERVLPLLRNADITIANFEGTFTGRGSPADKLYTFRTPPRFASGLADAGIDIVSLGNNHTADFGPNGVQDTIAALDGAGIRHAGAGMNEAQARKPALMNVAGLRVALLSYTNVMENTFAGADSAGVALATGAVIDVGVRAAKAQADVVIVALHSGVEYTDAPQPDQQALAHAAIDAGATLVLGHHPHTLQGVQRYRGGLIIYSLGNFVFDLDEDDLTQLGPRAFQTAVYSITLRGAQVLDVHPAPVFIDPVEDRPRPATAGEAAEILQRIDQLNQLAGEP
jgi:poly-gamma-glutamate synthesis protein (capsule biosynthesis protein)